MAQAPCVQIWKDRNFEGGSLLHGVTMMDPGAGPPAVLPFMMCWYSGIRGYSGLGFSFLRLTLASERKCQMFGSKTMTGLEKHVNRVCMNVSGSEHCL